MNDAFGYWLSGLVDGEGCFRIHPIHRPSGRTEWRCVFRLALRDDDRSVVAECAAVTGIGRVYALKQRGSSMPQSVWSVQQKNELEQLVDLFVTYPLRSKKARDFALWARAVKLRAATKVGGAARKSPQHNAALYAEIEMLSHQLKDTREYPKGAI